MGLLCFNDRYRVVIVIVCFLCLTSICSNYNIINFTFICMAYDYSSTTFKNNHTVSAYNYSPIEKSYIIWAVAVGTLISTFPFNYFYTKYGARYPFLIAGLLSTICTLGIPYSTDVGFPALLFLRFLQGVAYGADFAAIGLVCVRWAPLSETAIFICFLTSFSPISTSLTNGVSGALCESNFGWRGAFYLHAIAGFVVFFFWWLLYVDDPRQCSHVSYKELHLIQQNKSKQHNEGVKTVPYLKIITNPAVLCVWFCAFVELSGFIMISSYAPIYFHKVLGYDIQVTGLLVGVSTFTQLPVKVVAAFFSDKFKDLSEITKIHIFNVLSMGVVGVVYAIMGFVPSTVAWLAVLCYACINWFSCTNCGGFYKCGTHVSRQYAHFVIGTIQWMKCVALFTAPALVGLLVVDEGNRAEWRMTFLVVAVFQITANLASFFTFSDQPAEFTKTEGEKETEKDTMQMNHQ